MLQQLVSFQEEAIELDRVQNIDYVSTFIEEIQCAICKNLLIEPEKCSKCEKYFCSPCYNQWISQQEEAECPCCRQVLIQQLSTKPRLLYHLLHKIKLYCRYKNQGCQEIIDYEFRLKHEMNSCQFRLVDCQNCKEQILFKDLKQHEITCNDEAIECDKCCQLLKKFSLQDHKDNECLKREVQCPSCYLSLELDQLIDHYSFQCPQRCIICEECKATFAQADIEEHTQIICLTRQRNYFKKKCNQLRNQNRKLLKKKEQLEFIREYYGIPSDEEQW